MRSLITGVMAVVALGAVAQAAPNVEFSIGLCAAKTNAKERLACYDAIAAKLRAGEAVVAPAAPAPVVPAPVAAPAPAPAPVASPAPVAPVAPPAPVAPAAAPAPTPAAAPATQEAKFGAESVKKDPAAPAAAPEELDQISGAISTVSFAPNGRAIITLDNGQVWRQIDGDTTSFRGKAGDTVTIERAVFGSYSLTVNGKVLLIKVKRIH